MSNTILVWSIYFILDKYVSTGASSHFRRRVTVLIPKSRVALNVLHRLIIFNLYYSLKCIPATDIIIFLLF